MIQIQDDNFNQSAAAPSLSQNPTQPIVADPSHEDDSKKSSTTEIDQLLAELDKLSKNLDEDSTNTSDKAMSAPKISEPVKPVTTEENSPITEEKKFDFDSFLSDLEKKIDQEPHKDLSLDSEPTDFRKNRAIADPQVQDEDVDDITDEKKTPSVSDLTTDSEELKAQNIFEMLGLTNIEDEEKNKFLDDLESMIWDDFIFHDLELLLTSEEYAGARQILDDKSKGEEQQKEDLIAYLEKLVPDLDEVLYDKALELKSEMMGERLAKMKEDADEAALAEIKKAEGLISQNHWKSAVILLNQL